MIEMLFLLLVAHALADYPLQGDFLSKAKNLNNPIPEVPWYQAMGAHCLIHSGAVFLITSNLYLALAEFIAHWFIDVAKCDGRISYNRDQVLHIFCKVMWVFAIYILSIMV